MFSKFLVLLAAGCFIASLHNFAAAADSVVQLNMNRPLCDVNEKFVSFAIKPEELYRALDGENRRVVTRMAAMMGQSYIKFTNDYEFAMNSDLKLRNPTKIIWKGFNRWTRAINWTMAIPVPYDPENWDPMETLRILNSSYLTGITECVWQLGTDFGASHAEDYVADLNTLNMMSESFKSYVDDWRIMGADISPGSSADETRRYIAMSKDLNSAFGWTQSFQPTNALATLGDDNDPALRILLREKVPVWLTLPQKAKVKSTQASDETTEGLHWARTLGEAASTGYDVVFKRITAADLERPSFSYYVSLLFKRVMGSRVFPARPLNIFSKTNKLYTHCSNTVSGGLAFMIVNTNEQPQQIQVASLAKLPSTELWQFTLTMKKSHTYLNDDRLALNGTLRPYKTNNQSHRSLQLYAPSRSVNFWVLPEVNLDHCQYTEIVSDELLSSEESVEQKVQKRYSSADILLKKLIQESSLANNPLVRALNQHQRHASASGRSKRFVLKDKASKRSQGWGTLFQPFSNLKPEQPEEDDIVKVVNKREHIVKPEVPPNPFSWLTNLMENSMTADLPLLKRAPRSIDDDYFGPIFATKDGKISRPITKITEIRKSGKNTKSSIEEDEFDEEEFFKKMESYREPEKPQLPEGDVMLQIIASADGEKIDENLDLNSKNYKQSDEQPQDKMGSFKLYPTELYESMPTKELNPNAKSYPASIGSTLNSLLFPEPFLKNPSKTPNFLSIEKPNLFSQKSSSSSITQKMKDFMRNQQELSRTFSQDNTKSNESVFKKSEEEKNEKSAEKSTEESRTSQPETSKSEKKRVPKSKTDYNLQDLLSDDVENYFSDNDNSESVEDSVFQRRRTESSEKQKSDELPWWELALLKQKRKRRALYYNLPEDDLQNNLISKYDEFIPLGAKVPVASSVANEYRVENNSEKTPEEEIEKTPEEGVEKNSKEHQIITTFKEKVSNLVDIVARQVTDWYTTFTKHIDGSKNSSKKDDNSTKAASNNVK